MTEELKIYAESAWHSLDLQDPSGIVLEISNNLFNDFGNFASNRTFTFDLPKTNNNLRCLQMVHDLRISSNTNVLKYSARYVCNGVLRIGNANLYVTEITAEALKVCLTWGSANALNELSRNDVGLKGVVPNEDITLNIGGSVNFQNTNRWYIPFYFAGVVGTNLGWWTDGAKQIRRRMCTLLGAESKIGLRFFTPPAPVIPVRYLLECINDYYGLQLELPAYSKLEANGDMTTITPAYIQKNAVLPLVSLSVNDAELRGKKTNFTKVSVVLDQSYVDDINKDKKKISGVIGFDANMRFPNDFLQSRGTWGVDYDKTYSFVQCFTIKQDVTYCMQGKMNIKMLEKADNEDDYVKSLKVEVCIVKADGYDVLTSVEGVSAGRAFTGQIQYGEYKYYHAWVVSFDERDGSSNLSFTAPSITAWSTDDIRGPRLFLRIAATRGDDKSYSVNHESAHVELTGFSIYPTDYLTYPPSIDLKSSMPDISCVDFIKAWYNILGGFPTLSVDGKIGIGRYSDFFSKKSSAYNWSNKLISTDDDEIITVGLDEWKARRNYFLSSSDSIEVITGKESKKDSDDKYADGYFVVETQGAELEEEDTKETLPFHTRFLQHGNLRLATGNTLKIWDYGEIRMYNTSPFASEAMGTDELTPPFVHSLPKRSTAQPAIGYVRNIVEYPSDDRYITLEIIDGFANDAVKRNYSALRNMVEPKKLKIYVALTDYDIMTLDLSRPVYIEKYNSYFAISKVRRYDDKVSQCELYKINI